MADIVDRETRSRMMSAIRAENTGPEVRLRSALHRRGYRFRLHRKDLPGRPDIVLPRYRAVILVHGCFWHRHSCHLAATPGSNTKVWEAKFAANVARDQRQRARLLDSGWRIATVWECGMREIGADEVSNRIVEWLDKSEQELEVPKTPKIRLTYD